MTRRNLFRRVGFCYLYEEEIAANRREFLVEKQQESVDIIEADRKDAFAKMPSLQILHLMVGVPYYILPAENDVYDWSTRTIYLSPATMHGTSPCAHLCALHELSHWQQHRERPWLMWLLWLKPVRWWLEMDAWRRAAEMLREMT